MNAFRASAILALPAFAQDYAAQRAELVDEIHHYANLVDDKPIRADVLESLNTVERHRLVPSRAIPNAYENRPLSIGCAMRGKRQPMSKDARLNSAVDSIAAAML